MWPGWVLPKRETHRYNLPSRETSSGYYPPEPKGALMHTRELIDEAEKRGLVLTELARKLGLNRNALSKAKHDGRLSPALAAAVASELGEPITGWTLAAVAEGERSAPLRRRISELARDWRKR